MMATIDFMASRHDKTNDWAWKRNSYKYLREELPYFLWVLLNPNKHFIYPLDSGCSPAVVTFLKLLAKDFRIDKEILLTTTAAGREIASRWHSSGRGAILKKTDPITLPSTTELKQKVTVGFEQTDTQVKKVVAAELAKLPAKTNFKSIVVLSQYGVFPPPRPNSAPPALPDRTDNLSVDSSKRRSSAPGRLQTFFTQQYLPLLQLQKQLQKNEKISPDKMEILRTLTLAHTEYIRTVQQLLQQSTPTVEQQTSIAKPIPANNKSAYKK